MLESTQQSPNREAIDDGRVREMCRLHASGERGYAKIESFCEGSGDDMKVGAGANSFVLKSLRMSKRRGVAMLKNNIRGMGTVVSVLIGEKERENKTPSLTPQREQKPTKNSSSSLSASSEWVKVRQTGNHYKELLALHLCQEIQAHEGASKKSRFSKLGFAALCFLLFFLQKL